MSDRRAVMTNINAPPGPNDVRLRRWLDETLEPPQWPMGVVVRTLLRSDAPALHVFFTRVIEEFRLPYDVWWQGLSSDAEFDPALCFLACDADGHLLGAAQCWTSSFVKDLGVHPVARRQGIGEALLRHLFLVFKARGESHVDLKTDGQLYSDALRLYRRLGMKEVPWAG